MSEQANPKCVCGAIMIQSFDDVQRGNLTLSLPNGKYSCWPCGEIKRELLRACHAANESFEGVNAIGNLDDDDFAAWEIVKAAIAKAGPK